MGTESLSRPLIQMTPDEVMKHLDEGTITEDDALDYTIKRQVGEDFFAMSPDDVMLGLERGLISEEEATIYADRKDSGFLGYYAKETGRGIVSGVRKGIEELDQSANEFRDWVSKQTGLENNQQIKNTSLLGAWGPVAEGALGAAGKVAGMVKGPDSTYGKVVEGFSQGAVGYTAGAAVSALVPAAAIPAWAAKAPKLWNFLSGAAKGAFGDAFAFDPKDPRFSDMLEETRLANPLTEYLKSDPDDPGATGRFKSAVEGLFIGAAFDGILMFAKGMKTKYWAKNAGDPAAVAKAVDTEVLGKSSSVGGFAAPTVKATRADVDNIMQAMALTESGGRFVDHKGNMIVAKDAGMGKWQIMPATWKDWSMKKWGEVREVTPKNQEELTRWRVEQLVDEGYTPQQIASIWNSGRPDWEGRVGVNKWGVTYNVPKHVERFTKYYEKVAQSGPHRGYAQGMLEEALTVDQAHRVMQLGDALAETWAKRTGDNVQNWWYQKFGDIRTGGDPKKVTDALWQWAGPEAKGFAEAMHKNKLVMGADGKYRFEIPDVDLKLSVHAEAQVTMGKAFKDPEQNKRLLFDGKLGEAIEHKKLFENYPQMRNVNLFMDIGADQTRHGVHMFDEAGMPSIRVHAKTIKEGLEVLVHEMQHNIQWMEGFARGGSPEEFKNAHMMAKVRRAVGQKLKATDGTAANILDGRAAGVRKELLSLMGPDGSIPKEHAAKVQELFKQKEIYEKGVNDAINQFINNAYKGGDPYQIYRHLAGELEAEDAATRYAMARDGEDIGEFGHLESQGPWAREKAIYLRQGEKGAVQFAKDGKAILHLFGTADFSTVVHELGHMVRRDLDDEGREVMEKWLGITDGKWEVSHEEQFAKAWETYIANGKAPKKELQGVFDQMKQFMLDIYQAVKNIGQPITKDVEDVFNQMLGAESKRRKIEVPSNIGKAIDIYQRMVVIAKGNSKLVPKDLEDGGPFNLMKFDSPEEIYQSITMMADIDADELARITRGTVSLKETAANALPLEKRFARSMGIALDEAQGLLTGVRNLDAKLNAHMNMLEGWQEAVAQLAKNATEDADKLLVLQHIDYLRRYQLLVKGVQTETARGLSALRNLRKGNFDLTKMKPEEIASARGQLGDKLDRIVKDFAEMKDPAERLSYARKLGKNRVLEGLLEYRQASLLSGLGTHVANTAGNTAAMALEAGNRLIANTVVGMGDLLTKGETHRLGQNVRYISAFAKGLFDALQISSTGRSALWGMMTTNKKVRGEQFTKFLEDESVGNFWKALATGDAQLDYMIKFQDQGGGAVPKWLLGPIIRLPFRILTAEDELFKGMMYRAELTFQAYEHAAKLGKKGKELDEFIHLMIDTPDPEMHRSAILKAREATFSDNLEGAALRANQALNESSWGLLARTMFFPFTKVAVNMLKFTKNRTFVGMLPGLNKMFLEDLKAGGVRRAEAVTRLATGNAMLAIGGYLYAQGRITGSAPKSQREAWQNAGIQENSVRIGDKWVSYNRIQPISGFLRIGADIARLIEQTNLPEDQQDELHTGAMVILANQLSDSYMKSVSEFVDIINRPDQMNIEKWMNRQAGTFFPMSAAFAQANRGEGELLHDVSPELDLWNSFLGTYNPDRLPLRRHNVYGTTIEQEARVAATLNVRTVDDPVMLELARVGANVGKPARKIVMGGTAVELDDAQFDRYNQILSTLPIKEYLTQAINSPAYQRAQDDATKAAFLKRVVSNAREMAKKQLVSETPALDSKLREQFTRKSNAIMGIEVERNPDTQLYHWMELIKDE